MKGRGLKEGLPHLRMPGGVWSAPEVLALQVWLNALGHCSRHALTHVMLLWLHADPLWKRPFKQLLLVWLGWSVN